MCFVPAVKSSAVVLTIYRYRELGLVSAWSRSCKRKVFLFFFLFFFFCLFFFLDMVFNKVQFNQLVINEYVQLWYQLLIQIILYHGNPN